MATLLGMNAVDYTLGFETFGHELRWICERRGRGLGVVLR